MSFWGTVNDDAAAKAKYYGLIDILIPLAKHFPNAFYPFKERSPVTTSE